MSPFATSVREHMVAPLRVLNETDGVAAAEDELSKLGLSALPVVDRAGGMVGVLSRSDLLGAGRLRLVDGSRKVLRLPSTIVRELMTTRVEIVPAETPLSDAAARMVRQHIHRLYVSDDRRPAGVISTKEMMRALVRARITLPIAEVMHGSPIVVQAGDPLSLAIDRMAVAHHSSLVVLEDGWPVGVLSHPDALAAREARPDERVDHWMDARMICLPLATPLFRAAEQGVATRARCVLAVDGTGARGILTGMDFTRVVEANGPARS